MGSRFSAFEGVLLFVGIFASYMGFQLINQVYSVHKELSWLMVIAIFNWLMLLVMFVFLSLVVDISRKQFNEVKRVIDLLEKGKRK
jgi:fructose-specific phosphotransferase system IIC component